MYCDEKDSSDVKNRNSTSQKKTPNCDSDQKPKVVSFPISTDAHVPETVTVADKIRSRTSGKMPLNVSELKAKEANTYVLESADVRKSADMSATAVSNRNSTSRKRPLNCDSEQKSKDGDAYILKSADISATAVENRNSTSRKTPLNCGIEQKLKGAGYPPSSDADVSESVTADIPESLTSDDLESVTDMSSSMEGSSVMELDIHNSTAESENRFKCGVSYKRKAGSFDKYLADIEDNVESSTTASEELEEDLPFKRRHMEVEDVFVQSPEIKISQDQKDVFVHSSEEISSPTVGTADFGIVLYSSNDGKERQLRINESSASNDSSSKGGVKKSEQASIGNEPSSGPTSNTLKAKSSLTSKKRCHVCNKKVGLTGITCRCGGLFCAKHRYDKEHGCKFDYKALGRKEISKNNPQVVAEKVKKL